MSGLPDLFRMRVWSNTSCFYNEINEEKHKLVRTINRSLDRESNSRPLAYGNTARIKGTTTLTTKPNPVLQNRPWSLNISKKKTTCNGIRIVMFCCRYNSLEILHNFLNLLQSERMVWFFYYYMATLKPCEPL
jgi:hypothetical protein